MRLWRATRWTLAWIAASTMLSGTAAGSPDPIVHEPIPPNPAEDLAMHVLLTGNLPAAISTLKGAVAAPDPQTPPALSDAVYGPSAEHDQFRPDRDTRRPSLTSYDEPFTPATAPFKRIAAYDGVRDDYTLIVHDSQLFTLRNDTTPGSEDDLFFADIVIDLSARKNIRIPSVGPGARIVRAHLAVGGQEMPVHVVRDGADNWFLESPSAGAQERGRLVLELAVPRVAFGGAFPDFDWSEFPPVARLPQNVARDAAKVTTVIGVNREMRPRRAIAKLVQYFREFAESNEAPRGSGNIYLDLALSKRGVCRHRAFAFLVTAESLGIPTRMVENEVHAWVEVHDGAMWRRIDLGGAGDLESSLKANEDAHYYDPPADAFPWPSSADSGEGAASRARERAGAANGAKPSSSAGTGLDVTPVASAGAAVESTDRNNPRPDDESSERAATDFGPTAGPSTIALAVADGHIRRGELLRLRGAVHAGTEPCASLVVSLSLRSANSRRTLALGTLSTDDDGTFAGGLFIPWGLPLGDYEILARTPGDSRCGPGSN